MQKIRRKKIALIISKIEIERDKKRRSKKEIALNKSKIEMQAKLRMKCKQIEIEM